MRKLLLISAAAMAFAINATAQTHENPDAKPPFAIVLFGLGIVELLVGFATGRPPGSLVGMPVRFLAFAVGVCILLLGGRIA